MGCAAANGLFVRQGVLLTRVPLAKAKMELRCLVHPLPLVQSGQSHSDCRRGTWEQGGSPRSRNPPSKPGAHATVASRPGGHGSVGIKLGACLLEGPRWPRLRRHRDRCRGIGSVSGQGPCSPCPVSSCPAGQALVVCLHPVPPFLISHWLPSGFERSSVLSGCDHFGRFSWQ